MSTPKKKMRKCLKIDYKEVWCQVSITLRPFNLSELSCGTYVYHNVGERCKTIVSSDFLWNGFFKDSTRRHGCAGIAPQPTCRRLLHTPAIWYGIHKWHGMGTGGSIPRLNPDGWMFGMSQDYERHVDSFLMAWPSELRGPTTSYGSRWHQNIWVMLIGNQNNVGCNIAMKDFSPE